MVLHLSPSRHAGIRNAPDMVATAGPRRRPVAGHAYDDKMARVLVCYTTVYFTEGRPDFARGHATTPLGKTQSKMHGARSAHGQRAIVGRCSSDAAGSNRSST